MVKNVGSDEIGHGQNSALGSVGHRILGERERGGERERKRERENT
jgi:hypothetical protein